MSKKGKIIFGIITIILVFATSLIGLGFLPAEMRYELFFRFVLMVTPCMTVVCVINLLKENTK